MGNDSICNFTKTLKRSLILFGNVFFPLQTGETKLSVVEEAHPSNLSSTVFWGDKVKF